MFHEYTHICQPCIRVLGSENMVLDFKTLLLFHFPVIFPLLVTSSFIVSWLYVLLSIPPTNHSWLGSVNSLLPALHSLQPSCLLLPDSSLLYHSSHSSRDNSLLILSKSELLCLTCKASIISPHPIHSILFPTTSYTYPLNRSGY